MRTLEFRIKDKQVLNPLTKKNSLIEYKKSRTKSLIVEETPDFMKRQNFSVSVQQKGLKEALQVLKVLHFLKENPEVFSAMGVKILGG
jgi:predicted Zn-dependent protease